MSIKISEDGSIINGDQVITNGGTIIKDDGTIESATIATSPIPNRSRISHVAPVSPLEGIQGQQTQLTEGATDSSIETQVERRNVVRPGKSLPDLEYDLMVAEGHWRAEMPKKAIIVVIITLFLSIIHPIFLIGTLIASVLVFKGFSKRAIYKEEILNIKSKIASYNK